MTVAHTGSVRPSEKVTRHYEEVREGHESTMKKKERHHLKSVEIGCVAPDAQEVFVGGTFNGWDPRQTPMRKTAHGSCT
jgi:1,4-alpha-glucan branching enzyme